MNTAMNNVNVYRTTVNRISEPDTINNCLLGYSASPAKTVRLQATNLCSKCDDASKFFADDRTLTDTLFNEKIQWVQDKKANIDMDPYPNLEYPIYDLQNLGCEFLDSRPQGNIKIVRRTQ